MLTIVLYAPADILPVLTFSTNISDPWYNNGTVEIWWTYNEETSSSCQLLSPSLLQEFNCRFDQVRFSNLPDGRYTLYIEGQDNAGNIIQESVRWIAGKFQLVYNCNFITYSIFGLCLTDIPSH